MGSGYIGPYELREEIGRGAMARVWRAWDPNLEREVAIKEPLLDDALSGTVRDELGRRFVKEAKAAAKLNHPNIVSVYAADVYDGRPAIVMELVEGVTLEKMIEATGKISSEVTLDVLNQMLDGIACAHAEGIVHRDLKPANIFITSKGVVKIGDFGIAHVSGSNQTNATQMGTVLGTPGYMSPEQARGIAVDARSDLFSIGTIAYEMLTGANPFGATDGQTDSTTMLYRIVHEPVPDIAGSIPDVPAAMSAAIMCALQKDPDARPATAGAFKAMLNGGSPETIAQGSKDISKIVEKSQRPAWLPYVLVAAACVVVLAIVFAMATSSPQPGPVNTNINNTTNTNTNTNTNTEQTVLVPDVTGLSPTGAKDKLESAGFKAVEGEAVYSTSVASGFVRKQEPTGGSEAKAGDTVTYYVSKGPDPSSNTNTTNANTNTNTNTNTSTSKTIYYVRANDFVTLRKTASTTGTEITRIPVDSSVELISDNGTWLYVSYNGSKGYVLSKFMSTDPNSDLVYGDI